MSDALENHWEKIREDPLNYCPYRGDYPHVACDVALYEGGDLWSHLYGACHKHRTYWHMQSGGPRWEERRDPGRPSNRRKVKLDRRRTRLHPQPIPKRPQPERVPSSRGLRARWAR